MSGVLHVVGLGPGDPELMTVKAARLIREAAIVAYFRKPGRVGHAWTIAHGLIGADCEQMVFEYPFTTEIAVTDPRYLTDMGVFYEQSAGRLGQRLAGGADVALLCEGDPFLYGSSMYLYDRLRTSYRTEITPGVSGMSGCWSRAGVPITHGDDVLSVLPGTLGEDDLVARLLACDAAVIMKIGRNLVKIRAALARAGLIGRAIYVERGTMQGETILPFAELARGHAPYFALVLIPGRRAAR
jgi:precorrin-2/cobalt-factor-2 C20-methyltransferase